MDAASRPTNWRLTNSRNGDWAVIPVDTSEIPAIAVGDPKVIVVGERLIAFNVENGGTIIGGVDITGRRTVPVFGDRIQISPNLSPQAAGGPLLDGWGQVVGILGGSTTPGARSGQRTTSISPGVLTNGNGAGAAIPFSAAGILTPPIHPMAEFLYGSTALEISKKSADTTPSDVRDFSMRDPQVWVYSMWAQKGKLSKGMVAAKIYDQQNRLRVSVPPKKVSLSSAPIRLAFPFPTAAVGPGTVRIDMTWDDQPVWRTFIRISE